MAVKKLKQYTKDFKIQACELVIKDGLKPVIVAEKFGINSIMLYRWVKEYNILGEDAFIGTGNLRKEDYELKKLKQRIADLEMENEILKKAAAYFARHPKDE